MRKSPDLRVSCPNCGANDSLTEFTNETREFGPSGYKHEISDLSGYKCGHCEEIIYTQESIESISKVINEISSKKNGDLIKKVRKDILNLTQKDAVSLLSGGGHNAFSRYEQGLIPAPKPLMVLMRLLEKRPELLEDVKNLRMF